MSLKKYIKALLIYGIVMSIFIILSLTLGLSERESHGYLMFSPFDSSGLDTIYAILMITIASIIGALIFGYILGPLFLLAHKKIIGRKMIYGIQERPEPKIFKKYFLMSLFPSLMAINFALIYCFDPSIQRIVVLNPQDKMAAMFTFIGLLAIMTGIAFGAFSPVWFLLDSGIVYTNKEKVKDTAHPIEVRSVGGWYIYLLKGYAGISVILSFYTFFISIYAIIGPSNLFVGMNIMFLIFFPIMPLFVAILTIPALVLLDITRSNRKKFILKFASKLGIKEPLKDPFAE